MKAYLVGGAVRDMLLGKIPKDRDYVVVGSTTTEMLEAGYQQVGHDFPVFLHPVTKAEYALARTERKCGIGHTGFVCDFNPTPRIMNPQLTKAFEDLGYDLNKDYAIEELNQVLQRIVQSNVLC